MEWKVFLRQFGSAAQPLVFRGSIYYLRAVISRQSKTEEPPKKVEAEWRRRKCNSWTWASGHIFCKTAKGVTCFGLRVIFLSLQGVLDANWKQIRSVKTQKKRGWGKGFREGNSGMWQRQASFVPLRRFRIQFCLMLQFSVLHLRGMHLGIVLCWALD